MKNTPLGRRLILALTLSSLALSAPAAAQTQQYTVEVTLDQLARAPKVITVSPAYQVVLRFPMPISGLSVQTERQKDYKITPMQNRQVFFIDAKVKSGEADMYAVLPDTSILPFRLVIKNQPAGTRVYRVLGEGEVAQNSGGTVAATNTTPQARPATARPPAPATVPAPRVAPAATAQARPATGATTPRAAAPAVTSQAQVPTLPAGAGAQARTTTPAAATRPAPVPAGQTGRSGTLVPAPDDTPLDYTLTARREGTALVIDYTLKSKATRALIVRYQDLRALKIAGGRLNLTHLKTPQFGALLPGRTIQGTVRVESPVNSVILEWPMSNLATREHYSFNRVVSATR